MTAAPLTDGAEQVTWTEHARHGDWAVHWDERGAPWVRCACGADLWRGERAPQGPQARLSAALALSAADRARDRGYVPSRRARALMALVWGERGNNDSDSV